MRKVAKAIAVIPAWLGSTRFPGKNLSNLDGKPLVVHAIEFAKAHPAIKKTIVTTDSTEISLIADDYGVEWTISTLHSGERGGSLGVWRAALGDYDGPSVLLEPSSPCRSPKDVSDCLDLALGHGKMAYTVSELAPAWKVFWDRKPWHSPDGTMYGPNGAAWAAPSTAQILRDNVFRHFGGSLRVCEPLITDYRININYPWDLAACEAWLLHQADPHGS